MVFMMKLVDEKPTHPQKEPPATKQDIENLGDKLVWPPVFTRDNRLLKMQKLLKLENEVMNDPSLSDTEKVLRVAQYKQQYSVQNKELFEPTRLGAVPPTPLQHALNGDVPVATATSDHSEDSDDSDATIIQRPYDDDDESEDDDALDPTDEEEVDFMPIDYTPAALLSMVKPHRRTKTAIMLKKLAADGKIKWDFQGNVFYRGNRIPNANIGELVNYFQTAHKRQPLPRPAGDVIFGQALRKALATDDVQLGGPEDDDVRSVFKGQSPKTPRFATTKRASPKGRRPKKVKFSEALTSPSSRSDRRPHKRRRDEEDKSVTEWEY